MKVGSQDWCHGVHAADVGAGKSSLCLGQLGSQWRRCFCCHTHQRERETAGPITSFQGPHSRSIGYRLVRTLCMRCVQSADWVRRNPFNDSLIASGSDDGKVTGDSAWTSHIWLTRTGVYMEGPGGIYPSYGRWRAAS